jgi:hypothetical protein
MAFGGRHLRVDRGDGHEVDVVDREILPSIDEVQAAAAHAVHARDVQLHRLHLHRHRPGAQVDHALPGGAGVAHAQRQGGDLRRFVGARWQPVGVDDDVHAALAVQRDLARAVARHGPEAHLLEHLAVFDELDARQPQRVGHGERGFTVEGQVHRRSLGVGPSSGRYRCSARAATICRKCASMRAASAGRPVNSSNAPTAWPTAMPPPSLTRQPAARAACSSAVSSGK